MLTADDLTAIRAIVRDEVRGARRAQPRVAIPGALGGLAEALPGVPRHERGGRLYVTQRDVLEALGLAGPEQTMSRMARWSGAVSEALRKLGWERGARLNIRDPYGGVARKVVPYYAP